MTATARAVALMAGCRHQGSLRRVRSGICALVLAGAVVACVIVDVSSRELAAGSPAALRLSPGWPRAALEPYSTAYHYVDLGAGCEYVTLATPACLYRCLAPLTRHSERPLQEVHLQQQQVLGHLLLRRQVGDPGQRQNGVRVARREKRGRQPQGVGDHHVVVGEPVDDNHWPVGDGAAARACAGGEPFSICDG